jgi:hypothetical protein
VNEEEEEDEEKEEEKTMCLLSIHLLSNVFQSPSVL